LDNQKNGEFDHIKKAPINQSETIYYLTELKDLLTKFQDSKNSSYFLTDHSNINGLVSNVNLNSKPIYVYFYSLISRLEIELGNWLKVIIPEKELIKLIREKAKNPKDELSQETLKRFKLEKKKNSDNHFVEYLYFSQFQYIIKKKKISSTLGYSSNSKFDKEFKIISKYRNWFAHPLNTSKRELSKDLFQLHIALENINTSMESISIDLVKAYYSTTYKTIAKPIFSITIGKFSKRLNNYLEKENITKWAFISAENPYSIALTEEENSKRNNRLEAILKKNSNIYCSGIGVPIDEKWQPEKSYLIFNLSIEQANEIAESFQQNAYVYGEIDNIPELRRITRGNRP